MERNQLKKGKKVILTYDGNSYSSHPDRRLPKGFKEKGLKILQYAYTTISPVTVLEVIGFQTLNPPNVKCVILSDGKFAHWVSIKDKHERDLIVEVSPTYKELLNLKVKINTEIDNILKSIVK